MYSLEFTSTSVRRKLNISFWEGKYLVTLAIAQCGQDVPSVKSSMLLCSQVLTAISLEPTIICCAGNWTRLLIRKPDYKIDLIYSGCRSKR